MKSVVLAFCLVVVGCGGRVSSKDHDDVGRYLNTDFAPHHARLFAARAAYAPLAATDIDQPGKHEYLKFRIVDVSVPLLTEALAGLRALTPPAPATSFHARTIKVVEQEHDALGGLASALAPPDAARFKAAHERFVAMQKAVARWEAEKKSLIKQYGILVQPLPKVSIPGTVTPEATPPAP